MQSADLLVLAIPGLIISWLIMLHVTENRSYWMIAYLKRVHPEEATAFLRKTITAPSAGGEMARSFGNFLGRITSVTLNSQGGYMPRGYQSQTRIEGIVLPSVGALWSARSDIQTINDPLLQKLYLRWKIWVVMAWIPFGILVTLLLGILLFANP